MRPARRHSLLHEGNCPCHRCRFEERAMVIMLSLLAATAFVAWLYLAVTT